MTNIEKLVEFINEEDPELADKFLLLLIALDGLINKSGT